MDYLRLFTAVCSSALHETDLVKHKAFHIITGVHLHVN